jgi:hypothetical protein
VRSASDDVGPELVLQRRRCGRSVGCGGVAGPELVLQPRHAAVEQSTSSKRSSSAQLVPTVFSSCVVPMRSAAASMNTSASSESAQISRSSNSNVVECPSVMVFECSSGLTKAIHLLPLVTVDNRGYLYLTNVDLLATMGLVLTKRSRKQPIEERRRWRLSSRTAPPLAERP